MQDNDYNNNLIDKEIKQDILDILTNIKESKDINLKKITSLKESLVSQDNDHNLLAQKTTKEIDSLLASLDKEIAKYTSLHSNEAEEKKLLNSRDLVLRLKRGQINKVINEAKDNMASLQKECANKISAMENEITKLEKEYKLFTTDSERKTKAEVKKISDAILAPQIDSEELDLIEATEEDLHNLFQKEEAKINDLRIDGINKTYNIKKDYYDTKVQSERNYYLKKLDLKREIELLKNKEDEETANLNHIITEETNRLRDEEYFTNQNAISNLKAAIYKNKLYVEKLKQKTYDKIHEIYVNNDNVYSGIYDNRKALLTLIKDIEVDLINELFKIFNALEKQLTNDVNDSYFDALREYVNGVDNYSSEVITYLVTKDYHDDYLGNDIYDNHYLVMTNIASEFKKSFNDKSIEFKQKYENNITGELTSKYLLITNQLFNKLKEELLREVNIAYDRGLAHASTLATEENINVSNNINIHNEWYLVKTNEINKNKDIAKKEYIEEINKLKEEKREYQDKYTKTYIQEINDFKISMAYIKKQPKLINRKYDELYKRQSSRIETDYNDNIKKITLELEEKLMMCKKN